MSILPPDEEIVKLHKIFFCKSGFWPTKYQNFDFSSTTISIDNTKALRMGDTRFSIRSLVFEL